MDFFVVPTVRFQLHAGYAMIDTPTVSWLRVTTGVRIESSRQAITTGSRFVDAVVVLESTASDIDEPPEPAEPGFGSTASDMEKA